MGRLKGKTATIIGAGGYIGSAAAKLFAAQGARVICADVAADKLDALVAEITSAGGEAAPVLVDVTREEQVKHMIDVAVTNYGRLDVLMNCAAAGSGEGNDGNVVNTPDSEWEWTLKMHLYATIWSCRHAIPRMIETGGGSIINLASMLYLTGNSEFIAMGVAKAGIVALTKYVAVSHGKQGIRANTIAPGFAMSPDRVAQLPEWLTDIQLQHVMTQRLGNNMDQAHTALFLASDESSFMTGQTLHVDGGLAAHNPTMPQLAAYQAGMQTFVKR